MLRNHYKSKKILRHLLSVTQEQRLIHQQNAILYNKNGNSLRQGKIMGKLFGHRVSGSKKHWFPSNLDSAQTSDQNVLFKQSQFGKSISRGGKNDTRRMAVLNKLFMEHITDLMATGEISDKILGQGLQISKVKISQDFAYVNVYWLPAGDVSKDSMLEIELQRCSGVLRHELSQLCLMGVVPRIKFVKDKLFNNMNQVEALLKNMDFGPDDEEEDQQNEDHDFKHRADTFKQEFLSGKTNDMTVLNEVKENEKAPEPLDVNVPEMRHDVLGLDHKGIMMTILTKMRKSKQAWDLHFQNASSELVNLKSRESSSTIPSTSFDQLAKHNEKLAKAAASSEKFEAFLAKRKERRNTPERKKFRPSDHTFDDVSSDDHDYLEPIMSTSRRKIFEAEDFLPEDIEHKKI